MHAMTKGTEPLDEDAPDEAPPPAPPMPVVVWIHDGPVCVTIVEPVAHAAPPLHCQCQACRSALHADWAARFLK